MNKELLKNARMVKAHAKVNFSIDVLGKDAETGYHQVEMIMQQVNLYDRLFFYCGDRIDLIERKKEIGSGVYLASESPRLPLNEKNSIYKAAKLMMDEYGITDRICIYAEKHIPSGGGLGGGSSDGAAVMKAMNHIYKIGASNKSLEKLSAKLGSDVPFFVRSRAAVATGTGTDLRIIQPFYGGYILLVNPGIFVSTEKIYNEIDSIEIPDEARPDNKLIEEAMARGDLQTLASNLKNVLELATFKLYPEIAQLKEELIKDGALGALMSGSGATVYGLFDDPEHATAVMQKYRDRHLFASLAEM